MIGEPVFETKRQSILERQEIEAPAGFVSVFHETTEERLPQVDANGLKVESEANIGGDAMSKRNALIDQFRPQQIVDKGISRKNIFAYPFLEYGNGLLGADQRFVKKDRRTFEFEFSNAQKYSPEHLEKLGVSTLDEYIAKVTNPDYLKAQHPGEVLELKVDPKICYVGDMEYITRIWDDMNRGWKEKDAAERQAEYYWKGIVSLEDFLKWYKMTEWAENGNDVKDAQMFKD